MFKLKILQMWNPKKTVSLHIYLSWEIDDWSGSDDGVQYDNDDDNGIEPKSRQT